MGRNCSLNKQCFVPCRFKRLTLEMMKCLPKQKSKNKMYNQKKKLHVCLQNNRMFKKISKLCCVQTRVHPILMMHLSKCSVMFRVCVKETNSQSEVDDFPQETQTEGVYELNLRCFAAIAGNLLMTGVAAVPGNFPRKAARSARGRSCGSSPKLDRVELMSAYFLQCAAVSNLRSPH